MMYAINAFSLITKSLSAELLNPSANAPDHLLLGRCGLGKNKQSSDDEIYKFVCQSMELGKKGKLAKQKYKCRFQIVKGQLPIP